MDTKRVKLPHIPSSSKRQGYCLCGTGYRNWQKNWQINVRRETYRGQFIHGSITGYRPSRISAVTGGWMGVPWRMDRRKEKKPRREKLGDDQAYCLREHRVVDLVAPVVRAINGKKILYTAVCPRCGGGISKGAKFNDQS